MKKILRAAAASAAAFLALDAGAAIDNELNASDTLAAMTNLVLAACPAAAPLTHAGAGSTNGEQAMLNKDSPGIQSREQEVAPMCRSLAASRTCRSANPQDAECKVVALDGVAVVGHIGDNNTAGCDGVGFESTNCFTVTDKNVSGSIECAAGTCPGNQYCAGVGTAGIRPAFDFIRLVWFGLDHNGMRDCNSDVRRSLVDNWSNVFENSCANAGLCGTATGVLPSPIPNYPPAGIGMPGPLVTTMPNLPSSYAQFGGLARVLRRGDLSGTTDTFAAIVANAGPIQGQVVASVQLNPFCNGSDRQDGDPIRKRCNPQDAVCGPNVHSGLLQAVTVDENHTVAVTYPTRSCTVGFFPLLPARRIVRTDFIEQFDCPERENWSIGGFCPTPVVFPSTNLNFLKGDANCWNPPQNLGFSFTDGRVTNRYVRAADGLFGLADNAIIVDAGNTQNGFRNDVVNAYYRVRQNTVVPGPPGTPSSLGAPRCQYRSSTEQIGCLGSQIRCSLGFAGLGGFLAGGKGMTVDNILPTDATIQPFGLVPEGSPVAAGTYPIARRLFLCSMGSLVSDVSNALEAALRSCYYDPAIMSGPGGAVQGSGFIELPVGAIECSDFNETACNTIGPIACNINTPGDCGVFSCVNSFCDMSCNGTSQVAATAVCTARQPGATCLNWSSGTPGRCGFASNTANSCF